MREEIPRMRSNIILHTLVFLFLLVGIVMVRLDILEKTDLRFLWFPIYGFSLFLIARKFRDGLFYEPIVVLPSSYLFLVVFGTIVYEAFRGRFYGFYTSNLIGIGYCSLIVGIILSQNYCYRLTNKETKTAAFRLHPIRSRFLVYLFIPICLCATALLFVKGGIPLFASDVNEARLELFSGSGYLNVFFIGLTILSLALLYDSCVTNNKKNLIFSNILAIVVAIMLLSTGYRAKTIVFIAEYVSLFFFFKRRALPLYLIILIGLMLILFLGAVGSYRRGNIDVLSLVKEIGFVFTARPHIFELVVSVYDESNYFYGTRYFYDLKKLLPGKQEGANMSLNNQIFSDPDRMEGGSTPSIVGEAYMNFGPSGIPWIMLFVGITVSLAYRFMKQNPSFMWCAFYFTLLLSMAGSIQSGIGTRLPSLVLQWIWIFIIGILYEKKVILFKEEGLLHETYK